MKVAVLGAGNAGCALAADLSLRGHVVTLCTRDPVKLRGLQRNNGIGLEGVLGSHHVPVSTTTDDIRSAVADAELVVLAVPGMVQEAYLRVVLPHLRSEQALWLCPGNGGSLIAAQMLADYNKDILLIETWSIPYGVRRTGPASVFVRALITPRCAAFPAKRNHEALAVIQNCFDNAAGSANVLETILMNVNCIVHPLPAMMNWGPIERSNRKFSLYREGMTPGVLQCLHATDRERTNLCAAVGLQPLTVDQIYAAQNVGRLYLNEGQHYPAGVEKLEDRFITEDVPVGLVTIASIAQTVGVQTPLILGVIGLASALYGENFLETGRTAERLGLLRLTPEQVHEYLQDGSPQSTLGQVHAQRFG